MEFIRTKLPEVVLCQPKVFGDARGFFMESFDAHQLDEFLGQKLDLWRECHSKSAHHVLRGLHIQTNMGKLVRCIHGRIFDVAVDARPDSPRLGQWVGYELSADNFQQLWIPSGFLHGFYALSAGAEICYKVNNIYAPHDESAVRFDDTDINIDWKLTQTPILSDKDQKALSFRQYIQSIS